MAKPRPSKAPKAADYSSWRKTYETRDDFIADTGPVVRDALPSKSQALYDAARAKAAELLDEHEGRELLIVVGSTDEKPKRAYARVMRNGKLLAHQEVTR